MTRPRTAAGAALGAGALVLGLVAASPAVAHPGHPHPGDPTPPPSSELFQKVTLNDEPGEPMTLAVLPDGRVLHNTRAGDIRLYDPNTGASPVITTDPGVPARRGRPAVASRSTRTSRTNKWVYLYYAPKLDTPVDDPTTPQVNEGDAPAPARPSVRRLQGHNQLSRFKFEEPTPHLDLASEQKILQVAGRPGRLLPRRR